MWLNWEKDKQPSFYTLSGFGLSDLAQQPANGIGFNTGKINRIGNISLGLLLTQLLKQGNWTAKMADPGQSTSSN